MPCVANSLKAQSFKSKLVGNEQCGIFVHGAVTFDNASLFDGPPSEMADLTPVTKVTATYGISIESIHT